jgi:hypothetical protein
VIDTRYNNHNPLAPAGCDCTSCTEERKQSWRGYGYRYSAEPDEQDDGPSEADLGVGEWRDD